jgi:hypothetical protein
VASAAAVSQAKRRNDDLGLAKGKIGGRRAQPLDIIENRQGNVWKSLEKTRRILEKLGLSLEKFGHSLKKAWKCLAGFTLGRPGLRRCGGRRSRHAFPAAGF